MWRGFERGSSPVDWCEGNYKVTPYIAEFVNTISNIVFFIMPPLLIFLHRGYGRIINKGIHILWSMFIIIGFSSAYFHATLSYMGQLLDELSILWLMAVAMCMFHPKRWYPKIFKDNRRRFSIFTLTTTLIVSLLGIVTPFINAFFLMILGCGIITMLHIESKRLQGRVHRLSRRSIAVWIIAATCWTSDRFLCTIWHYFNMPYLHGVWHVLSFIAAYTVLIVFSHSHVEMERPDLIVKIGYWPHNSFELGVPYIDVRRLTYTNGTHISQTNGKNPQYTNGKTIHRNGKILHSNGNYLNTNGKIE